MDIKENEEIKIQTHDYYADFELQQFVFNFENPTEKVVIRAFNSQGAEIFMKEFIPKFINTHLNITWQDKGVKSEESLYETIKVLKT